MNRSSQYERKDRLSGLLREILASALSKLDDPALEFVSITDVEVDNELNRAIVYFTTLEAVSEKEEYLSSVLGKHYKFFQKEISSSARLKKIPKLKFCSDEGMRKGQEIEEIIKNINKDESGTA